MVGAGIFCVANLLFIVFGLWKLKYTGYGFDYLSKEYADFLAGVEGANPSPTARVPEIVGVGVGALLAGILGYVVAQRQHGRPFRFREPSDEAPSQEAIDAAAAAARAR